MLCAIDIGSSKDCSQKSPKVWGYGGLATTYTLIRTTSGSFDFMICRSCPKRRRIHSVSDDAGANPR